MVCIQPPTGNYSADNKRVRGIGLPTAPSEKSIRELAKEYSYHLKGQPYKIMPLTTAEDFLIQVCGMPSVYATSAIKNLNQISIKDTSTGERIALYKAAKVIKIGLEYLKNPVSLKTMHSQEDAAFHSIIKPYLPEELRKNPSNEVLENVLGFIEVSAPDLAKRIYPLDDGVHYVEKAAKMPLREFLKEHRETIKVHLDDILRDVKLREDFESINGSLE